MSREEHNKQSNYDLSINLQNEFNEDKDQSKTINLQLSSKSEQIPLYFLCKYSQIFQDELVLNEVVANIEQKVQYVQSKTNIKEENFSIFFKMLQEKEIIIDNEKFFDFYKLSGIFKISVLRRRLKNYCKQHSHDIDFLIAFIQQETSENDEFLQEVEKSLSDNINECFENENFGKLHIPIIYRIIEKSDFNKLSSDKLYEFISKKIDERCPLFSFLNLQKLSKEKFTMMYNKYSNSDDSKALYYQYLQNNLNLIKQLRDNEEKFANEIQQLKNQNNQLKEQISKSFNDNQELQNQVRNLENDKNHLQNQIKEFEAKMKIEYPYDRNNQFNGILKHLTNISNGNIHANGTIEITCSGLCCGSLNNLVDFNDSTKYTHIDSSRPFWFQIDFKTRKIQIKSYLIKSRDSGDPNFRYLKSWSAEISNDGNRWEKIDKRENVSELNGQDSSSLFNVSTNHQPFRFFRISTNENNWSVPYGDQGFSIGKIEFFGNIIE